MEGALTPQIVPRVRGFDIEDPDELVGLPPWEPRWMPRWRYRC